MKAMFLVLPVVYLAGNGYLFWRVWQVMGGLPVWCKVLGMVLLSVVAFALFAAIGLREVQMPAALSGMMFSVGAVWMVALLYMVLLLAVFDVAKVWLPCIKTPLWYALVITLGLMVYGYVNYRNPRVERIDVALGGKMSGRRVRIVAVSDVHLGYGTGLQALRRYVEMINECEPDLILISGDLIDNSVKPLLAEPFDRELAGLKAGMGVYMVPGNHEYISGIDRCAEFLDRTGIKLLRDTVVNLECGVQIVGRDDRMNRGRKTLAELLERVDRERAVVVMDHQPYGLAEADAAGVDLQVSGHTHRGQVWPLNWLTDMMYEQSHGYRKWEHAHIWVSSGLSLWGPPFRIGTNSDFAVIELHK